MDERFKDYETTDDGNMVSATPKGGGPKFPLSIADRASADRALLGYARGMYDFVFREKKVEVTPSRSAPFKSMGKDDLFPERKAAAESRTVKAKAVKKNKIAWVEGVTVNGGAEISGALVRKVGAELGFQVDLLVGDGDPMYIEHVLKISDIIVLNNLFGLPDALMKAITDAIKTTKYVKYEHDHRELDRPEFSKELFSKSALNVFLSPIHLENHREKLGCEGICLPLAIDVDLFHATDGVERAANSAVVANCRNFKSWQTLQKYINEHSEITFTVLTNDSVPVAGENVKGEAMLPYEKMPSIYSEHEYLVHLLDGWGAGERVVWEACLCGCKVIANEKVGHVSWGRDFVDTPELREWLGKAPFDFWREVSKRI
jgi:hypothetical protein